MSWLLAISVALLLVGGAMFSLTAAIGINRLPDLFSRMHAASKAGTVGSGLLLLAVGLYSQELPVFARAFAGFLFVVATAPIAAHLLAKTSHQVGYRQSRQSVRDDFKADKKTK